MPKMEHCTYNGKEICIHEALKIKTDRRESNSKLGFSCIICNCPVKAFDSHIEGGPKPHFEHFKKNPDCPLSDKRAL